MDRKQLGAWYTPPELVAEVATAVEQLLPVVECRTRGDGLDTPGRARHSTTGGRRVLDPACGDGRLLTAVADRLGGGGELVGCDIDPTAVAAARAAGIDAFVADALHNDWGGATFDVVVGNPPFLSQMAAATSRGGSSRHGGGPYADAAVEFLALAARLARPDGGVVALVLPQSILGARDAGPVRAAVGEMAGLAWSWWQPAQALFDAAVNVCVLGLRRGEHTPPSAWTRVVTDRLGVPALDPAALRTAGSLGERAGLNANFRDEYYALVPAVSDTADGPPLVTSGLIDPGVCHWGARSVRFAKHEFAAPRVDLGRLTGRFPAWAARKLVAKVLVANQTKVIEAVADPHGAWLPGVPVSTATPTDPAQVWELAAVLTSPVASVMAWQAAAGTGLSTSAIRLTPAVLAATPWPSGSLDAAVAALRAGDVAACAHDVCRAYGLGTDAAPLLDWWHTLRPG
ncbi:MAG TPA: class I SAM-dependent methyltransferase [Ilumatobacter sp.]|nr:class I SAM-dependent methyltransferase [Ilumatobacter sp.]